MNVKMLVGMALLFVVVLFTLQNTEAVSLSFLFWEFTLSRALMFFLIFSLGILLGYIFGLAQLERHAKTDGPVKPL